MERGAEDTTRKYPEPFLFGMQSCYGHTEGAAGVTGALLALCAVSNSACPPIINLRDVNPYVGAAMADWAARGGQNVLLPRQYGPTAVSKVPTLFFFVRCQPLQPVVDVQNVAFQCYAFI